MPAAVFCVPECAPLSAEKQYPDGRSGLGLERRLDLASRAIAAIRLWAQLHLDDEDAAEGCDMAVFGLEHSIGSTHPQLLIQAGQALGVPSLKATMCALARVPSDTV